MSKWDVSKVDEWKAEEFPRAAIIPEAGNSEEYSVGGWRSERPWHEAETCTNCMLCFIFCPDSAIKVEDGKVVGIDYEHCKGCGICANECPTNPKFGRKSMQMAPEGCELKVED